MRDTINSPSHDSSQPARRSRLLAGPLSLVLVLTLLLAACSGPNSQTTSTTTTTPRAVATATSGTSGAKTATSGAAAATATATSGPTATTGSATATPGNTQPLVPSTTPAAPTSGTPAETPSAADTAAIKAVIQKANQEQQQAFAQQNPTIMKDTSTPSYYNQLVQGLNDMASGGVAQIKLVNLQWGNITLQGTDSAQATTSETWDTTFVDGSTLEETDTNVYTLVKQNGNWLIQEDQHPDSRLQQPAGPTGSTGSGSGSGTGVPTPVPAAQPGSADQSRNWAGYAATGGTYTAVSGSWTVPNVAADTSPAADATWVGIGGVNSTDLIQAGTDATVESGQVVYAAWIETLPQAVQNVPLDVAAGDKVSVSITQQSTGTWQIIIKNLTTNHNYQTTVSYNSSLSSAEWIEESPVAGRRLLLPLDSFGSVTFTGATTVVNGKQETLKQAGAQPITLSSSSGQPLATTSGINATGDGFTVTRTDVPANPISPGLNRRRP